jgi:hypothetical protein
MAAVRRPTGEMVPIDVARRIALHAQGFADPTRWSSRHPTHPTGDRQSRRTAARLGERAAARTTCRCSPGWGLTRVRRWTGCLGRILGAGSASSTSGTSRRACFLCAATRSALADAGGQQVWGAPLDPDLAAPWSGRLRDTSVEQAAAGARRRRPRHGHRARANHSRRGQPRRQAPQADRPGPDHRPDVELARRQRSPSSTSSARDGSQSRAGATSSAGTTSPNGCWWPA